MRWNLDNIPESPAKPHPFFLMPERKIEFDTDYGNREKIVLHYREAGCGRPILLLHGLWTSAYTFRYLVEPLSSSFRLIIPELTHPDHNGRKLDLDYRPERLARLFSKICQSLELARPLVVAHAESGLGALLLAMEQPQLLSGLLTLCTYIQPSFGLRLRGRLMKGGWLRERWARKGFAKPQQAACSMLDYEDFSMVSRQEIRRLSRQWASLPAARAISTILAQTLSPDYHQALIQRLNALLASGDEFLVPTKLVVGKSKRCLPRRFRDKLAMSNKNTEILRAPNGTIHVESPEWTAEIIASFASKYLGTEPP